MADISITAANVVKGENAVTENGTAGETIAAGKAVYLNSTTKKYMLADSNSGTAEVRRARGIALNSASLDQPLQILKGGDYTAGGTFTAGVAYYLSDTPGGICAVADVGSGEYVCLLGIAKSASVLAIDIQFPGVAL
jgi:hypothetical protein